MLVPFKLITKNFFLRKIKTLFAPDPSIILNSLNKNEDDLLDAISIIKFDNSFKTTFKNRHQLTQNYLSNYFYNKKITVIDFGASYGTTSLDIIKKINFFKYYVTDKNNTINIFNNNNNYYFYNDQGRLILFSNSFFILYFDEIFTKISFFKFLFKKIFSNKKNFFKDSQEINLTHPDLLHIENVKIIKHNIFNLWNYDKADLIILGNILNLSYFKRSEIIDAIKKILKICNDNSIIAIIDNREIEQSSIFKVFNKKLFVETIINGGSDIHSLITNNFIKD